MSNSNEATPKEIVAQPVSHPFCPNEFHRIHMPSFNNNLTPRYIYRLVAPQSAGTTNSTTAVPPAAITGTTQDIFQLPSHKAARRLLGHLLWQRGHGEECNLMSWTSSLLFALQYALYHHCKDGGPLSNILLVILDTSSYPEGTFVQDIEIMRAFQGVERGLDKFLEFRESKYYFGEYLTQGRLDVGGKCVCTSVQKLVDLGLFQLQPALGDETQWQWWPKRVLEFRDDFISCKSAPTTAEDVATAVEMAEKSLGGNWTVPCALMFLALQPRKKDDRTIIQGFKARFTESEIEQVSLGMLKVDEERLPEVGQFKALATLIHTHYNMSEVNGLLSSVEGLKL